MASVNRHEKPEAGVTEIRVHGVGGTTPETLLEQTGTRQVAGDETAGFFRGAIPDPTRTVEAYSWGGLTARSRSRAFWVLLLPFSLVNLAGWMVEPRPLRRNKSEGGEGPDGYVQVAVDRDRGTKVHETIVQWVAIATTAMYVMWTALISINTIAFQCGAIAECRESRWFAQFFGAGFFVDHPGHRVIVGLLPPLVLLGFFMYLGKSSRVRYDEYGKEKGSQISADTVDDTRTAIGRVGFWFPGRWQKPTGRLHVAVTLLIIGGLLGRAIGRFEETLGDGVADDQLGSWVFRLSVLTAVIALLALAVATARSDHLLGDDQVDWFEKVASVILGVAAGLFLVSVWLTWGLEAPDAAVVPPGNPAVPVTDYWGFGWAPVLLLMFAIVLVGLFSGVQIVRWIQWHFIHFDQILVAAMLLMIVLWPWALWVAVPAAIIAIVADLWDRFRPEGRAAENGDGTKKPWRLGVFLGFMAGAVVLRLVSEDWTSPFGLGWPRVTPILSFTLGLTVLCVIQARGHLNAPEKTPKKWTVQVALLAVPAAIIGLGWGLSAALNREEWVFGAVALAWCVAAVVWLAQFEHSRWRWNGPGAVAMLGLAIVMGAFSGLMIWLIDLLDGDGTQFVLRSTGIYQWLTVIFAAMLVVLVAGQLGWLLFVRLGLMRPAGTERRRGEVLPVALRAVDVVVTVAVMVLLASMIALVIHLNQTYPGEHLKWIDDRPSPPEDWGGIVKVTAWIALGVVIGAVLAVRNGLRDRGFRTRIGVLWDVASFWPRSFHPFAPPPYTARAVPEIQSRLKEVADLNESGAESEVEGSPPRPASSVILSGHSQGSVVSLAVIATLPAEIRRYVWLFTHGSPLATLYRRFFPKYFPVELFDYGAQVDGGGRFEGRWLNYWRRTDLIGGPCFDQEPEYRAIPPLPPWSQAALDSSKAKDRCLPDIRLDDPLADPPTPYSPPPSVRGHSGYMADPAMWRALDVLAGELSRAVVAPASAAGSGSGPMPDGLGETPSPDPGPGD
jgi:hypothetical protein